MTIRGETTMEHHGYGFSITTPLGYTAGAAQLICNPLDGEHQSHR
jgi:hypothetical protein